MQRFGEECSLKSKVPKGEAVHAKALRLESVTWLEDGKEAWSGFGRGQHRADWHRRRSES